MAQCKEDIAEKASAIIQQLCPCQNLGYERRKIFIYRQQLCEQVQERAVNSCLPLVANTWSGMLTEE
jgi:hypothetical protein